MGLLLLKPQFALVLALVLLGKGRWEALGGLLLTGLVLVLSTIGLVGADGSRGYLEILREFSGFRRVPPIVYPQDMINFRGILVNLLPAGCTESQGKILVLVLSGLLTASLVMVWRGRWDTSADRFPRQVLATMIVAMFTGFHNHIHGATLLIVPALALIARDRSSHCLTGLFVLSLFLPTYIFLMTGILHATGTPMYAGWTLMALMTYMYVVICVELCQLSESTLDFQTGTRGSSRYGVPRASDADVPRCLSS
jgi:hypothetical protein